MNEINNELPTDIKNFFNRLKNYLDTDLYFYGSVTRSDYVPGKSDIDVAIFTDNEYSTMSKLQHFLHVKRSDFDKVVWKLNSKMIYGYKIKQ
jgi:predicted nucleotidyltransferase